MTIPYVKSVKVSTIFADWLAWLHRETHPLQPSDAGGIVSMDKVFKIRANLHHVV
jgi:hypothetical protein